MPLKAMDKMCVRVNTATGRRTGQTRMMENPDLSLEVKVEECPYAALRQVEAHVDKIRQRMNWICFFVFLFFTGNEG